MYVRVYVVHTTVALKCTEMKIALARHAKLIFFKSQICKFVTFLLPSSSCLPKVPFAAFDRTHTIYGALLKATSHIERTFLISDDCCGASVASEQQHNQDIRRIYYVEVGTNSSPFTRIAFN